MLLLLKKGFIEASREQWVYVTIQLRIHIICDILTNSTVLFNFLSEVTGLFVLLGTGTSRVPQTTKCLQRNKNIERHTHGGVQSSSCYPLCCSAVCGSFDSRTTVFSKTRGHLLVWAPPRLPSSGLAWPCLAMPCLVLPGFECEHKKWNSYSWVVLMRIYILFTIWLITADNHIGKIHIFSDILVKKNIVL